MIRLRLDSRVPTKERPKFNAAQRRAYTPETTRRDTMQIRRALEEAMAGRPPAAGPVGLQISAEIEATSTDLLGSHAMRVPDLDNLEKIIKDAGNGLVYIDDKQVAEVKKRRIYATSTQVLIVLYFLDEDEDALFSEKEVA